MTDFELKIHRQVYMKSIKLRLNMKKSRPCSIEIVLNLYAPIGTFLIWNQLYFTSIIILQAKFIYMSIYIYKCYLSY
jgi:hypothetical protein